MLCRALFGFRWYFVTHAIYNDLVGSDDSFKIISFTANKLSITYTTLDDDGNKISITITMDTPFHFEEDDQVALIENAINKYFSLQNIYGPNQLNENKFSPYTPSFGESLTVHGFESFKTILVTEVIPHREHTAHKMPFEGDTKHYQMQYDLYKLLLDHTNTSTTAATTAFNDFVQKYKSSMTPSCGWRAAAGTTTTTGAAKVG